MLPSRARAQAHRCGTMCAFWGWVSGRLWVLMVWLGTSGTGSYKVTGCVQLNSQQAAWFSLSMKSVSAHSVAVRDVLVYLCGG